MTNPTAPQLTESEVNEIETVNQTYRVDWRFSNHRKRVDALIRDWRALKARIEALTTDWCECGHSRDKHQFFSDHDECYECDQASPDLCCEWRPAPRPNENDALREQLAQLRNALEPLTMNGRLFTFHRNVEEGDYFECGICHQEAKQWREIKHSLDCKIEIAQQVLEATK